MKRLHRGRLEGCSKRGAKRRRLQSPGKRGGSPKTPTRLSMGGGDIWAIRYL